MSLIDYVIDLLLIALVLRQIRRQQLTASSIILPSVLIIAAGVNYLRPFHIAHNDLVLIVLLTALGTVLGILSGLATRVWRENGVIMCQAGIAAAVLWTVGMAGRFAFAYYSTHGGRTEVAQFSISHGITGDAVWVTALVLMAFGEVLARVLVLQIRRIRQSVALPGRPLLSRRSAVSQQSDELAGNPVPVRLGSPTATGELVVQARAGQGVDHVDEPIERGAAAPSRGLNHSAYQL